MNTDSQLEQLRRMWRIRVLEEKVQQLRLDDGEIVGSVHLCNGQEAIPVGVCQELSTPDAVFATYRGHGWALARGVPPEAILAELMGRASGVNEGRGGSAYFSGADFGFLGENSIVGGGVPIATGAALAASYDGSGRVTIVVFGDGAMNQGAVHESMNLASARSLPVVFVCENNKYSELTPINDMVRETDLAKRPEALGIPAHRIDGNQVDAVVSAAGDAIRRARSGDGPSFIEARTRRIVGHYIGDAQQYRPAGELDQDRTEEPIVRLKRRLVAVGMSQDQVDSCERSAREEIDHATETALASPKTDPSTVREHLYG